MTHRPAVHRRAGSPASCRTAWLGAGVLWISLILLQGTALADRPADSPAAQPADTPGERPTGSTKSWNFDDDVPGRLPAGFTLGTLFDGRPAGEWKVFHSERARSSMQVLAQVQSKGADHAYKMLLINGTEAADLEVEVAFLLVGGKAELGAGVIWRAADDRNYYLLRVSAVEQNIRLYRVVKGVQQLVESRSQTISLKSWHRLRVRTKGCELSISYDGRELLHLCDRTFQSGRIGLWTRSDAVTYFDDLVFTRLS
jgi:hypothetical protein